MYKYLLPLVLFSACNKNSIVEIDPSILDQCLRREIFMQCLAAVPKGPEKIAGSNDWGEVVGECASVAQYMSVRRKSQVKVECQP